MCRGPVAVYHALISREVITSALFERPRWLRGLVAVMARLFLKPHKGHDQALVIRVLDDGYDVQLQLRSSR